jgi:predicted DNA-binding transcriptional regulator YafY
MRHNRLSELIRAALLLQTADGASIEEIKSEFNVSRRTAERMRDALLHALPHIEESYGDDRRKRWKLPRRTMERLAVVSAEELAALEIARRLCERENLTSTADRLADLSVKVRVAMPDPTTRRVEPDFEALTQAEGIARRPGPRRQIDPAIWGPLREAVLACRRAGFRYLSRSTGRTSWQSVEPYGFLYGPAQHYLVALSDYQQKHVLFALSGISDVTVEEVAFQRDATFSLQSYADQSFGVFQDDVVDVVWKFSPEAAPDARQFLFHPSQEMIDLPDGSLLVRFRAAGQQEMRWHLYQWGNRVEVLEPKGFMD